MKLYKYMTYQRAVDFLSSGLVRFTQPAEFNDPFELHPSFDLMSKSDISELPDAPNQPPGDGPRVKELTPEALQAMLSALLPGIIRLVGQRVDHQQPFVLDNNRIAQGTLNAEFGILSLTECPYDLLMWAHYADCHRGVAIQFDADHPFFVFTSPDGSIPCGGRVEYRNDRPVLSYSNLPSFDTFFRKSTAWSYEKEWRFIRRLADSDEVRDNSDCPIHLFQVPSGAITGILFGAAMSHEHQVELVNTCQNSSMAQPIVYQLRLSDHSYSLEVHPQLGDLPAGASTAGKICEAR